MSSIFILADNINNYSEKQKNKIYKLHNRLKKKYDKVSNSLYIDIWINGLSIQSHYYRELFFKFLIIKDYDAVCILGSANTDNNREFINFIKKNNIKIIRRNRL